MTTALEFVAPVIEHRLFNAVQIRDPELEPYSAPNGFPFLVRFTDSVPELIEPVARFLGFWFARVTREPARRPGELLRKNSASAIAADLKDWWEYLSFKGLNWDRAEQTDVEEYRNSMLIAISPHTHRPFRRQTIRRRLSTLIKFYAWAKHNKLCNLAITDDDEGVASAAPGRPRYLAGLYPRGWKRDEIMPRRDTTSWSEVRCFSPKEYRKVADGLGPKLTDKKSIHGATPFRLVCDLMVTTGIRISEALSLTIAHVDALDDIASSKNGVAYLRLTATKGNKPRSVPVPTFVIHQLKQYLERHRPVVAKASETSRSAPLFLNGRDATRTQGRPLKPAFFRDRFNRAVKKARLIRPRLNYDLQTGHPTELTTHTFTPHCLRHTFAIWRYYAERSLGNPEPWKIIQAILGHAHLTTTLNIYLKATAEYELSVSNKYAVDYLHQIIADPGEGPV